MLLACCFYKPVYGNKRKKMCNFGFQESVVRNVAIFSNISTNISVPSLRLMALERVRKALHTRGCLTGQ